MGVCFAGVRKFMESVEKDGGKRTIPTNLYYKWLSSVVQIQNLNKLMNHRCVELQEMVLKAGFQSYIMKGQGNALLYDCLSDLRQVGDIDIYLDGGFKNVMNFVETTHPTKNVNELEIHYHCFNDVPVEIHYKPFVMDGPKDKILQRFFEDQSLKSFANKSSLGFSVPTIEFNLVHQLVHIHHHLFYEGVGLRQLMDYFFLLKTRGTEFEDSIEKQNSETVVCIVVEDLNLERFASALMWVLGYVFGLGNDKMLWKPCEDDGRFLLNEIVKSGNFGKMDYRQKGLYESKWNSFWILYLKSFRFWRFDYWAWFWSPISRIKSFMWRKFKGYR